MTNDLYIVGSLFDPVVVLYLSGFNIEQWTVGYGSRQNQRSQAKDKAGSYQQDLDPTIHYIISIIVP